MKVVVVVLSVLALSQAQVQVRLPFINPAGVTFTGAGFGNVYSVSLTIYCYSQSQLERLSIFTNNNLLNAKTLYR